MIENFSVNERIEMSANSQKDALKREDRMEKVQVKQDSDFMREHIAKNMRSIIRRKLKIPIADKVIIIEFCAFPLCCRCNIGFAQSNKELANRTLKTPCTFITKLPMPKFTHV